MEQIKKLPFFLMLAGCLLLPGCRNDKREKVEQEDLQAKQMLQGVWVNEDDGEPAWKVKGDTIFFPDATSQPLHFKVIGDTLVLTGANTMKYPIVRQMPHVFQFRNQNGELVKLDKSSNPDDAMAFELTPPEASTTVELNQRRLIKRDTVVTYGSERYHCYVQVNPTSYKVYKSSYNEDGVEVDNVFFDNIIHLSIFRGAEKVFSRDFHKNDFRKEVPSDFLKQGVLNELTLMKVDASGFHYDASICLPDSPNSFEIELTISFNGRLSQHVING